MGRKRGRGNFTFSFGEKKILLLEDLEESLALKIKKTSSPHFLVFISSGWRGGKEWDDSTWVKVEPPRGDWEDFWEKRPGGENYP